MCNSDTAVTIDQIIPKLLDGSADADSCAAQIEMLIRTDPSQARGLIGRIQAEIAGSKLSQSDGRTLLAAIDRGLKAERTAVMEKTIVLDDIADADSTSMRTPAEATAVQSDETRPTVRPIAKTLLRSAPAQSDETNMRSPAQATQANASAALRIERPADDDKTHAAAHDPDATLATVKQVPPTAARTLQMELSTEAMSPYAATLKSADKTEVIAGRLVQSLDDVDEGRRGALQPGSIVKKRFVLETLLGKGGMGLVFGAIDRRKEEAQDPNPRVALKVLNADFERHPQSFIALQREARKAQTLAHPNVVTVFDFDRDGDTVYMTMELLKGKPLEAIVRECRGKGVKPEVALPIIRGIAEGLAYAHRKGIVHSDLKPGNVFIGEDGTPKILDFGIARAVPSSVTADNKDDVFDAGSLGAYTEAYATDEMIDGIDPHPADDLYALGIIGYELLTGYHPYQRHGAPAARKLGIKPPALRGLKLREAKALERCLSFDRKQRPADAGDFLKAFRGVTTLQKASIAAAVVLAMVAGYFGYQNYLETSPAIAFEELPLQVQQDFRAAVAEGDQAWAFYESDGNAAALEDAIRYYSAAYALHPRNREAVGRLQNVADEFLELSGDDRAKRRLVAQTLREHSEYFLKYKPVVDAAR